MTEYHYKICPICGVQYALESTFDNHRIKGAKDDSGNKLSWSCPNGHSLIYSDTEADKLRRERDLLAQRIACRDDEIKDQRNQITYLKGQTTKLTKRIKAGVCPCCTRHFTNLERHIASKHPEFDPTNVVTFEKKETA